MQAVLQFHSNARQQQDLWMPPDAGKILSNFVLLDVEYAGVKYPSVEHAFQAQKYLYTVPVKPELSFLFTSHALRVLSAQEAKSLGGKGGMKKHGVALDVHAWGVVSQKIMKELLWAKVERHEQVRSVLQACRQYDICLVHFSRNDMFWGAHVDSNTGFIKKGKNRLGQMYHEIIKEMPLS